METLDRRVLMLMLVIYRDADECIYLSGRWTKVACRKCIRDTRFKGQTCDHTLLSSCPSPWFWLPSIRYANQSPQPISLTDHYYSLVFLLFQEPTGGVNVPKDDPEHNASPASRRSWNAMAFADKHNLKLVGANFLLTETTT